MTLNAISVGLFTAVLLIVSVIDIQYMIIPDKIISPAFIILFVLKFFLLEQTLSDLFLTPLIAFVLFFSIFYFTKGGMGLGDAKLSAFISLFLGIKFWFLSVFLAVTTALLFCILMLYMKKMRLNSKIAFGPFLSLGAIVTLFIK